MGEVPLYRGTVKTDVFVSHEGGSPVGDTLL